MVGDDVDSLLGPLAKRMANAERQVVVKRRLNGEPMFLVKTGARDIFP
jgi:hypothetical protein